MRQAIGNKALAGFNPRPAGKHKRLYTKFYTITGHCSFSSLYLLFFSLLFPPSSSLPLTATITHKFCLPSWELTVVSVQHSPLPDPGSMCLKFRCELVRLFGGGAAAAAAAAGQFVLCVTSACGNPVLLDPFLFLFSMEQAIGPAGGSGLLPVSQHQAV